MNAQRIAEAKVAAGITEEVNTWAAWRDLGFEVIHESKALFQVVLIHASKGEGKTYKATTNSKGKAVFKIKNLKKKGTFKATITYKGNKYYNKVSKKANIKVIVTFKTVSKGSKDKSTVKEIQQALKDHGYYLSYKGHYLKVDGKFKGCTERSVKQFQKDKGLKVTGKVDEKTAKKLGLI